MEYSKQALIDFQVTGLTPQELTQLNLDKSRLLDEVIADVHGGDADIMLGELQVTPSSSTCPFTCQGRCALLKPALLLR